jgi:hypothetical protein
LHCEYDSIRPGDVLVDILNAETTMTGKESLGQVKDGYLKIRANMIPTGWQQQGAGRTHQHLVLGEQLGDERGWFCPDLEERQIPATVDYWCLPVYHCSKLGEYDEELHGPSSDQNC